MSPSDCPAIMDGAEAWNDLKSPGSGETMWSVIVTSKRVSMKNLGFLALAAVFLFGAYRYVIQPSRIKEEFPGHPVGDSPVLLIRSLGVIMAVAGVLFVYLFFKSLFD